MIYDGETILLLKIYAWPSGFVNFCKKIPKSKYMTYFVDERLYLLFPASSKNLWINY